MASQSTGAALRCPLEAHKSCSAPSPPSQREMGASCVTGSHWSAPCIASPQNSEHQSQGNERNSLCVCLPCCLAGHWVLFPSGTEQHYFQCIFDKVFCISTRFFWVQGDNICYTRTERDPMRHLCLFLSVYHTCFLLHAPWIYFAHVSVVTRPGIELCFTVNETAPKQYSRPTAALLCVSKWSKVAWILSHAGNQACFSSRKALHF